MNCDELTCFAQAYVTCNSNNPYHHRNNSCYSTFEPGDHSDVTVSLTLTLPPFCAPSPLIFIPVFGP